MRMLCPLLLWGMLSLALAEVQQNLAVLDFPPSTGLSASELQMIADRVETELIQTQAFQVLERRRMGDILQEQGFQAAGACSGEGCEIRMGQLLGVDKIVTGSVGKVGSVYSLNLKLVDVGTGAILRSEAVDAEGSLSEVLTRSCRVVARRFAGLKEEESQAWKWWLAGGVGLAATGLVVLYVLQGDPEPKTEVVSQQRDIQ